VSTSAMAETAYVTDMYQLGVHERVDASDNPFTYLRSADAVEILDRNALYARVRIPDGREGWVKSTFLVDEPPAALRIESVQKERDEATLELASLKEKVGQQNARIGNLENTTATSQKSLTSGQAELDQLRNENAELNLRLSKGSASLSAALMVVGLFVSLIGGFIVGWWWVDRRSRLRHGGVRIY
jgi:SH3 domain protein